MSKEKKVLPLTVLEVLDEWYLIKSSTLSDRKFFRDNVVITYLITYTIIII